MFTIKITGQGVHTFYVNDSKPVKVLTGSVQWFMADGDELEVVRLQFANLPITKGNHCRWVADMAEFVFDNLQLPWPPIDTAPTNENDTKLSPER